MKFSWNSVRISIAGAKLSHLAQKDKIWDHGSMIELAKNVFYKMEKARLQNNTELVKKSVTEKFYLQISKRIKEESAPGNAMLTEVAIISVKEKTTQKADHFVALLNGKRKLNEKKYFRIENIDF